LRCKKASLPWCSLGFEALDMPMAVISVTFVFGWMLLLKPRMTHVGVDGELTDSASDVENPPSHVFSKP